MVQHMEMLGLSGSRPASQTHVYRCRGPLGGGRVAVDVRMWALAASVPLQGEGWPVPETAAAAVARQLMGYLGGARLGQQVLRQTPSLRERLQCPASTLYEWRA